MVNGFAVEEVPSVRTVGRAHTSLMIAHRGGQFWKGSKFEYVAESVKEGADIVELDIRRERGEYVVRHGPFGKNQGRLADALARIGSATLYVDLKDSRVDVNHLMRFIRETRSNQVIVGSFSVDVLRRIEDPAVIRCLHCVLPWTALKKANRANADWISLVCYFVTEKLAQKIQAAGFAFVPSGNLVFKHWELFGNQMRFARYGALAVSTYHVRKMKSLLSGKNGANEVV